MLSEVGEMNSNTLSVRRAMSGFTLIELMIAVVVVAILATVALPSYAEFVKRGSRAEVQAFLMEIALRQQQRLVDRREYAATIADLGLALPKSLTGKYTVSMSAPVVVPPTFTISAAPQGAQTSEGCGSLTLDSAGQRSPANCWH
jgi:type IV pilus assembly protein PilE